MTKIKFSHKGFDSSSNYEAELKNTTKGIEISNVTKKYAKADEVMTDMLFDEKPPYWFGDVLYNKKDRMFLKEHIDNEIQYQQERLKRLKLLSKALTRKVYYLKN